MSQYENPRFKPVKCETCGNFKSPVHECESCWKIELNKKRSEILNEEKEMIRNLKDDYETEERLAIESEDAALNTKLAGK